jgi:hypothetical protein
MSEPKPRSKRPRGRKQSAPQYQYHPRAVNVTVYTADGSPIPQSVIDEINVKVGAIVLEHKLLYSVLEG